MLSRIFGHKKDEVTDKRRKLHLEEIVSLNKRVEHATWGVR
jgi:hypothetical protein